jgi:hypothetical protein
MSRKLGTLALAMGILVGAMGLKTVLTANTKGTVLMANNPAPVPPPIKPKPPRSANLSWQN